MKKLILLIFSIILFSCEQNEKTVENVSPPHMDSLAKVAETSSPSPIKVNPNQLYSYKSESNGMAEIELVVFDNNTFQFNMLILENDSKISARGVCYSKGDYERFIFRKDKPVLEALFSVDNTSSEIPFIYLNDSTVDINTNLNEQWIWGVNCSRIPLINSNKPVILNENSEISITDYFPFNEGTKCTYRSLSPINGKYIERKNECFAVKTENEAIIGMFYRTEYGVQARTIYESRDNLIQMTLDRNAVSGGKINPPIIVLIAPTKNGSKKWNWGQEKVYESKFVSSVKTSSKEYNDCILVIEKTVVKSRPDYKPTTKNYYAKGVGLVKSEFFDSEGVLNEGISFELTFIESK